MLVVVDELVLCLWVIVVEWLDNCIFLCVDGVIFYEMVM